MSNFPNLKKVLEENFQSKSLGGTTLTYMVVCVHPNFTQYANCNSWPDPNCAKKKLFQKIDKNDPDFPKYSHDTVKVTVAGTDFILSKVIEIGHVVFFSVGNLGKKITTKYVGVEIHVPCQRRFTIDNKMQKLPSRKETFTYDEAGWNHVKSSSVKLALKKYGEENCDLKSIFPTNADQILCSGIGSLQGLSDEFDVTITLYLRKGE